MSRQFKTRAAERLGRSQRARLPSPIFSTYLSVDIRTLAVLTGGHPVPAVCAWRVIWCCQEA